MKAMIVFACLSLASSALASGWAGAPANIALSNDGRNVLDTPEVAHAKAAHLAALAQAQSKGAYDNPNDDGSYDPRYDNEETWQSAAPAPQWNAPAPSWNQAPAPAWNAAPAHGWNAGPAPVAETPEVAQARAAHLAALASANSADAHAPQWNSAPAQSWNAAPAQSWNAAPAQSWNAPAHNQGWQGPPAQVRLSHDGSQLLDTPEVAAARAAHLAAHAQAAHGAAPAPAHGHGHGHGW